MMRAQEQQRALGRGMPLFSAAEVERHNDIERLYEKAVESKKCKTIEERSRMFKVSVMKFILKDAGRKSFERVDYCIFNRVLDDRNGLQWSRFILISSDMIPNDIDENEIERDLTSYVANIRKDCESSFCRHNWITRMMSSMSLSCANFLKPTY